MNERSFDGNRTAVLQLIESRSLKLNKRLTETEKKSIDRSPNQFYFILIDCARNGDTMIYESVCVCVCACVKEIDDKKE